MPHCAMYCPRRCLRLILVVAYGGSGGGRPCQSIRGTTIASPHPSLGWICSAWRRLGPGNWVPYNQLDSPTAACVSPHAGVKSRQPDEEPIPLRSIIKGKSLSAPSMCCKLRCTEQVMMQLWNVKHTHNGETGDNAAVKVSSAAWAGASADLSTLARTCVKPCAWIRLSAHKENARGISSRGVQDRPGTDNNIHLLNVTQPTHTYTLNLLSNHTALQPASLTFHLGDI